MASNSNPLSKHVTAGLELARQAFLYGTGDGEPVLDTMELIRISGLSGHTIKKNLKSWVREREQILIESGKSALGYHLSGETLEKHREDVEFLRAQSDKLKIEAETLPEIEENLLTILENMAENLDFEPDDADKLISLTNKFFAAVQSRQKVLTLFLATQKRWQESSGMASQLKAWETGQREAEKGRARVESKQKELDLLKDGSLEVVTTPQHGVFMKKKKPLSGEA